MIHEWRSYRLKPGAATGYLALLAEEGLPLVTRHLPLMGYWLADTGPLNTIHHLWAYADWEEREAARTGLSTEDGWTAGFIPRAFAMVEEQENRFLHLIRSSPTYDAALARRRSPHLPRPAGAQLYASQCAALQVGVAHSDAVAVWECVSGRDMAPFSLLARSDNPVPASPVELTSHIILRPLAFSPL